MRRKEVYSWYFVYGLYIGHKEVTGIDLAQLY